jgi:hypothetical protein
LDRGDGVGPHPIPRLTAVVSGALPVFQAKAKKFLFDDGKIFFRIVVQVFRYAELAPVLLHESFQSGFLASVRVHDPFSRVEGDRGALG